MVQMGGGEVVVESADAGEEAVVREPVAGGGGRGGGEVKALAGAVRCEGRIAVDVRGDTVEPDLDRETE